MRLTLDTPIIEFHQHGISKLTAPMARKLAAAVAGESAKSDLTQATVEDLTLLTTDGDIPRYASDRFRVIS